MREEESLINKLLDYELKSFARKLGFDSVNVTPLSQIEVVRLFNYAETLSHSVNSPKSIEEAIVICALLYEHFDNDSMSNLFIFIKQILFRLGLAPTARMIERNGNDFSSSGSFFLDLQNYSSIFENSINFFGEHIFLTKDQNEIWSKLESGKRIGVSAPTSAGKSFIICHHLIKTVFNSGGDAIYIVPNISLINQVTKDLIGIINRYQLSELSILQSYNENDIGEKNIFVLTQERALALINNDSAADLNFQYIVFDEVQNIERTTYEDNERADDLRSVINYFHETTNPDRIVISGPRITNIGDLVDRLFRTTGESQDVQITPVVNVTYSFSHQENEYFLNLFSTISDQPRKVKIDNTDILNDRLFGRLRLNEETISILNYLTQRLQEDPVIVFASTKSSASRISSHLTSHVHDTSSLIEFISDTVHPEYNLVSLLKNGVAYHTADVPHHIRSAIEIAFKGRMFNILVTTTTLIQGVNMPAKYIIARNPNLDSKRNGNKLTAYEFANLRGRAGRLMSDFIGRAITIDHQAFIDEQMQLFEYPSKEVETTYHKRFHAHSGEIISKLENNVPVDAESNVNDLIIFARNQIYRYGIKSLNNFEQHEITLPRNLIERVQQKLNSLVVPKKLCVLFPHWDVLELDKLFRSRRQFPDFPNDPFNSNLQSTLTEYIDILSKLSPYYYQKYFKPNQEWKIDKIVKLASDWVKEKPLREILENRTRDPDSEKITVHLNLISQSVQYSLPKLIKPIVFMKHPENILLANIEKGVYTPLTKKLIDKGIPREVALRIVKKYPNIEASNKTLQLLLGENKLSDWDKKIIEPYIGR
jgi:replicative superfamily II helicase